MRYLHKSKYSKTLITGVFLCLFSAHSLSNAASIDFEGLADSEALTSQYSGVTFSNATVLTSGISLNETEFPPHSGSNVIVDNGGPISISFSSLVTKVNAYFTYTTSLTLVGYDSSTNTVATSASQFTNNTALSGVGGSKPNELISLAYASGLSSITITGDPNGGSFVLDDLSYTPITSPSSVPIPAALWLVLPYLPMLFFWKRRIIISESTL